MKKVEVKEISTRSGWKASVQYYLGFQTIRLDIHGPDYSVGLELDSINAKKLGEALLRAAKERKRDEEDEEDEKIDRLSM